MIAPGFGLLLGGLLLPLLPRWLRKAWVPALGLATLLQVANLGAGDAAVAAFWGYELHVLEVDVLRLVFGWAFAIAVLLWGIYAWDLDDRAEKAAGLLYAGSALLCVFAGDWLTFFFGWEGMALASTAVILAGRTQAAYAAAFRYVIVHVLSGVLLLSGIAMIQARTGSLAMAPMTLEGLGPVLLFLGMAVNAAIWPLAAWLPDAYPEASPTGTVLLATFTTKTAVFALAFVFAGTTALCVLGALMAAYGVIYALSTRNYRRLLAFSLVGQVGFMLCAVGVGPAPVDGAFTLGQSAAAAHALMHILYKSLLFMTAGAVLLRTGRVWGGAMGGLRQKMPWTFGFAVVGAASICALPLTGGFASKTLIFDALHEGHGRAQAFAQTVLLLASAAAPLYVGLRYPWLAFGGRNEGVEAEPASLPMRIGMGATALLCIALGLAPGIWMRHLPALEGIGVYTWAHLGKQLGLLAIGAVLFLLWRGSASRTLLPRLGTLPDVDRLWRAGARGFVRFVEGPFDRAMRRTSRFFHEWAPEQMAFVAQNPAGFVRVGIERLRLGATALFGSARMIDRAQARFAARLDEYRRTRAAAAWPIGRTVFYVSLILALALVVWLVR